MLTKIKTLFRRLWATAPVATAILIFALGASVVFGVRAAVFWYTAPPWLERQQPIEAWMTPRYIARSLGLSPRDLMQALKAPMPPPDGPMSLSELAEIRGVTTKQIIAEAEAAVAALGGAKDAPND